MNKPGNSVKPNSSLHNTKVTLSLAPYQKWTKVTTVTYEINVNAKTEQLTVTYTIVLEISYKVPYVG